MRTLLLASLWVSAFCVSARADTLTWDIEILPDNPSWTFSIAEGMNEDADVVGRYGIGTETHAVLWELGSSGFVDVESAFGGLPAGAVNSFAEAINDTGLIGGTIANGPLAFGTKQEAIIWDRNTLSNTVIHPTGTGFDSSRIAALNDTGIGAGHLINLTGVPPSPSAYVWDASDLSAVSGRLLPEPAGFEDFSFALDVNESGFVAGFAAGSTFSPSGPIGHALVWAPDDTITDLHPKLVAVEGDIVSSRALGVSDDGVVAGIAFDATFAQRWAFKWDMATDKVTLLDRGGEAFAVANGVAGRFIGGSIGDGPGSLGAIWVDENSLDRAGFERDFVDHARRNVEAAGQEWNDRVEAVVRSLVPGRWDDVIMVLRTADRPLSAGSS